MLFGKTADFCPKIEISYRESGRRLKEIFEGNQRYITELSIHHYLLITASERLTKLGE